MCHRTAHMWALGCLVLAAAPATAKDIPLVGSPSLVQQDEVLVYPAQDWTTTVIPPEFGVGQHLALMLEERLATSGSGGCNWVLQVRLNEVPLAERLLNPRLLNKRPTSDLRGAIPPFPLYDGRYQAWNTLFSPDYDHVLMFDDDDYHMVWDVSDYVRPGASIELAFHYAQPIIPAILKQPAPLALRNISLGVMQAPDVQRLQRECLAAGRQ